ncbi:MAG: glycosyltransferase family 4 protein [Actinomycetota bacterium]
MISKKGYGHVLCLANSQMLNYYIKPTIKKHFPGSNVEFVTIEEFRPIAWQRLKEIRSKKYEAIVLACYDYELQRGLEKWQGYFLLTGAKQKLIIDLKGNKLNVTAVKFFLTGAPHIAVETLAAPFVARSVEQRVDKLLKAESKAHSSISLGQLQKICYLRTDHWFGIKSGGSVTHIAGVSKGFSQLGYSLFFISTDKLELVDESVTPINVVKPKGFFKSVFEVPEMVYNKWLVEKASPIIERKKPDMLYQRYSTFNYSGVLLARKYKLPFVLEYNGSEVWIAKNWGTPFKYQEVAEKIELLNLKAADLIVVVSEPLKEGLVELGIPEEKILVNPNGVDESRLHPDIDGNSVRQKYGLKDNIVVGFIGTFGRWHGAEVLAKAVKPVIDENPNVRFLFVGDGVTMSQVREAIKEANVKDYVILTGMVPQPEGPTYLAACDILASPHVPNPDGSKFFGSPTKLFEYMAMGKGIVASDLDQIGEVLEHNRTAWLVKPGDVDSLVEGLKTLIDDNELRERLGKAAREEVVAKYTWKEHTRRIVEALKERCG